MTLDMDDDFRTVDLPKGNSGSSRIRTVPDDNYSGNTNFFGSNSPPVHRPNAMRPPNLMTTTKDSDIGIDLLINKDKTSAKRSSGGLSPSNMNLGSGFGNNNNNNNSDRFSPNKPSFQSTSDFMPSKIDLGGNDDFDIDMSGPVDDLKPVSMLDNDNFMGNQPNKESPNNFFGADIFSKQSANTFIQEDNNMPPKRSFEDIQKEKGQLLRKLNRFRKKGYFIYRNVDENSDLEDIRNEYENVKEEASLQRSLRAQKDMLITTSRLIEGVASTELVQEYTGKLELAGWSTHMMETIDDYEDVMEDLHEKYGKMFEDGGYPEARLLYHVIHSAVMFHVTKKYIQTMPNLGTLLNTNPNLMKEFSKATANFVGQQSPAFADLMADGRAAMGDTSPRDMQGPSNLDDILADLKNSRSSRHGIDLNL